MSSQSELFYIHRPTQPRTSELPVEFLPIGEFLASEPLCKVLWELISSQFRTRSKFLAVWGGVQFVAVHRDTCGKPDGFLLVNTPVNWQIDYVVVRPERRGRGIGAALVAETLNQAFHRNVPFVTLTSKPRLRPLYEACGFTVADPLAEAICSDHGS